MKHSRGLSPINSNKHYVHRTNTLLGNGAILNEVIAHAVVAPAVTNAFDVRQGSTIHTVHIDLWISGGGATGVDTQFTVALEKLSGGQPDMTTGQIANLGAYPNKKNILFTGQGVLGAQIDGNQSIPIMNAWFSIPKGKQRMGLDDQIIVNVFTSGTSLNICGLFTYKEYT